MILPFIRVTLKFYWCLVKIEKKETKVLDNYHIIRREARAQARQKAEAAVL